MSRYVIVGVVAALAGSIGTWALRPATTVDGHGRAAPAHVAHERRSTPRGDSSSDQARYAECKRALVQQRAELRIMREEAARAADRRADVLVDDDDIGMLPSARSAVASRRDEEAGAEPVSERHQRHEVTEKVRDAIFEHLQITQDEQAVMKDLLCSRQDNLRTLYSDFAAGQVSTEDFFQALRQERSVARDGLEQALGKRRYRSLARVGAIGLLTPRLCKRE